MVERDLSTDEIYAGVMVVDLATPTFRVALSGDFETYAPTTMPDEPVAIDWLDAASA